MAKKPQSTSEILEQQLAAKKTWRKKRAALPMSEKVKVLEKLRAQNRVFCVIRKRRAAGVRDANLTPITKPCETTGLKRS